ncbi:MAG: hypothetical protein J0L58_20915 [Burkholderiales bacterium]|nr:hypothetical protein [Burkholderiales bacterium]
MAQQLNLFDASLRPRRSLLTPLRLGAAALLLLALIVAAGQWLRQDAARWRAQAAADQARLQQLAASAVPAPAAAADLDTLRRELSEARFLAQALQQAEDAPREQAAAVLAGLSAAAGAEVWIHSAQWRASPRQLSLEGGLLRAEQLPAYLRRLEGQPAFAGQGFAQLQLEPVAQGVMPHHRFALRSQAREGGR